MENKNFIQPSSVENPREEFRKFFIKIKKQLKLDKSLENVMWIHFQSAGFDSPEKFEQGLIHFGYRMDK